MGNLAWRTASVASPRSAFIVLKASRTATFEELQEHVRTEKRGVHVPRMIHVVDTLPLTRVGEVDKKQLRSTPVS